MAGGRSDAGLTTISKLLSRSEHGGDKLLTVTVVLLCGCECGGSFSVNCVGELGKMVVGLSILLLPL